MSKGHPVQIISSFTESAEEANDTKARDKFQLEKEALREILAKVPANMKVSIVSVVGAFRTGKSFLLTLFLRFLKSSQGIRGAGTGGKGKGAAPSDLSMDWLSREGSTIAEGNRNKTNSSSSASSSSAAEGDEDKEGGEEGSFAWRGGSERMTTGIWMWSEPFVHFSAAAGADVAVLLMDTQGMFDNESTMTLTAQIFGISTLVSSLQIYNVQNQIGEDKLQHLALFSEYGRIALLSPSGEEEESSLTSSDRARAGAGNQAQAKENAGVNQDKVSAAAEAAAILAAWNMRHDDNGRKQWRNTITNERTYDDPVTASSTSSAADLDAATDIKEKNISAAATKVAGADAGTRNVKSAGGSSDSNTGTSGSVRDSGANAAMQAIRVAANTGGGRGHKPFQHLQFLVRDWANFDTEWPTQSASFSSNQSEVQAIADLRGEMKSELSKVISYRDKSDLQSTREQISRCFETVDAWLLPHPGTKVTNKSYDGKLDVLDPLFRVLVDRLARHIFDECLEPKRVHSRHVTAPEMLSFFEAYVRIFQEENNAMPKAMTMLDATANANNRNAYDLSMGRYKAKMSSALDKDGGQHVTPEEFAAIHDEACVESWELFKEVATMGSLHAIEAVSVKLNDDITVECARYRQMNELRNPYRDFEKYFLPACVALASWILSVFVHVSCSSATCISIKATLGRVYMSIFVIGLCIFWTQIKGAIASLKAVVTAMQTTHKMTSTGAGGARMKTE